MSESEKVERSLPCIVCRKSLEDALPEPSHGNQPYSGLEFLAGGHYGSTIFDMEPGQLVVNICDDCVTLASANGIVRRRTYGLRPHEAIKCSDTQWLSPKCRARSDQHGRD